MKPIILGCRSTLRVARGARGGVRTRLGTHRQSRWTLPTLFGISLLYAAPAPADEQSCKLSYAEAFQLISVESFNGHSKAEIRQRVDDLFGPRLIVCEESAYKFFLTELGNQAAAALRQKGSVQEAWLVATREIMNRFPLMVRYSAGADASAGLNQLRSNLAVLSTEVGKTPSIRALLAALAEVAPPRPVPKPVPEDDDDDEPLPAKQEVGPGR